ncbi:MAG: serine hydrolase [Candidatus Falkowbacteria bacterium]|nr:serine hydrolase [Candidatus Falkowbacteria bacterium]
MRFSFFPILILLVVSLLFCSLFIFYSNPDINPAALADTDGQNQALGAIDTSINLAETNSTSLNYSLPPSNDKQSLPPRLKDNAEKIDLENVVYLVMDKESGAILLKQNESTSTAIASITKLATALVFLEQKLDWERTYKIKAIDIIGGGKSNIMPGEEIKIRDLFFLSLASSDNSATEALVHATGMTDEKFGAEINRKLAEWQLDNTHFSDPTGLSNANVSTAADVAKLAKLAFANKDIREATLTKRYEFITKAGVTRVAKNTDLLLDIFPQNGVKVVGGKTGYTENAGYCFVGQFVNGSGHEIISVILGGPDINSRFAETKRIVHWTYNNYLW